MGHNVMISGTWFQPFGEVDYPETVFDKNAEYWHKEFEIIKGLNFDTFIFQFSVHNDEAYYPSKKFSLKYNILDMITDSAVQNHFDLALGLYLNSAYYNSRDYEKIFEEQYKKTILVFDELFEKYKYFFNLKYWYVPQEIEATTFAEAERKGLLINFMNKVTSYIRHKSDLPIMIAPYFSLHNIAEFSSWWSDFLQNTDIDIIIMQDGMGCYRGIKLEHLASYYKVLQDICKSNNVKLWSTLENFEYVDAPDLNNKKRKIIPGSADRIQKQIEIERQYAEKIITFEFSHFMSPQFSHASEVLYKNYLQRMS